MVSPIYLLVIVAVTVIVGFLIWRWWKNTDKPSEPKKEESALLNDVQDTSPPPTSSSEYGQPPPLMVFAINDSGNFDLTDISGTILNSSFEGNPKIYINLLDQAEKDIAKDESTGQMVSTVGNTKLYQIGSKPYIVNFTRL